METLTKHEPKLINKKVSKAFSKDIYLLGKNIDGEYVWLEGAKWDCNWYWGFGYIETYTNNKNPHLSRDISSHSHWDSSIIGKHDYYDSEKSCFRLSSDYVHHLNDSPKMAETTLTEAESWKLAELMKTFYTLREAAEMYHMGGAHVTANPCADILKNEAEEKRINEVLLPAIFKEVYKLLTPQ